MNHLTIYGLYDDEDVLIDAVKKLKEADVNISEVYTPFPIHGLDKVLGLRDTRLSITAFIYGGIGLGLGLLMMWYMLVRDWPINIGGKPNFTLVDNVPAFIPVAFEMTVLFAALGMVFTFWFRSSLFPGAKAKNPFPETTNDKFAIEIAKENDKNPDELKQLLSDSGAYIVKHAQ